MCTARFHSFVSRSYPNTPEPHLFPQLKEYSAQIAERGKGRKKGRSTLETLLLGHKASNTFDHKL